MDFQIDNFFSLFLIYFKVFTFEHIYLYFFYLTNQIACIILYFAYVMFYEKILSKDMFQFGKLNNIIK